MFCSKCGTENADTAKFCSKCGAQLGVSVAPAEGASQPPTETSTGLSAKVAGLLCYVAGWITGIVFLVLEKKSKFVKFHAWQSIMTFGILTVVQIIVSGILASIARVTSSPGLLLFTVVFGAIIGVIFFVLWIVLMLQAYSGKMWKLPWVGDWAERQANKTA